MDAIYKKYDNSGKRVDTKTARDARLKNSIEFLKDLGKDQDDIEYKKLLHDMDKIHDNVKSNIVKIKDDMTKSINQVGGKQKNKKQNEKSSIIEKHEEYTMKFLNKNMKPLLQQKGGKMGDQEKKRFKDFVEKYHKNTVEFLKKHSK